MFCLNNAGSEVIDNLSSAGKWLRHGQKLPRVPGARPATGPPIAAGLGGLREDTGSQHEPYLVISKMTFPGKSQGKAVSVLLSQAVGWLIVQMGPPQAGAILSHFPPENRPDSQDILSLPACLTHTCVCLHGVCKEALLFSKPEWGFFFNV